MAQPTPGVHSGNASLCVNKGSPRANYTGQSLNANTTYTLTYWVKTEKAAPIGVTFGTDVPGVYPPQLTDLGSSVLAEGYGSSKAKDTNWHQYSATLRPLQTSDIFAFAIDSRPAASDFYIDDVVLVVRGSTTNLVEDSGFETAYQSHFDGAGGGIGWATANWVDRHWYSEYAWHVHSFGQPDGPKALTIEGTPAVVHSGGRALRVNRASPRANYTPLTLTAGTPYTLTYWLKTEANAPVGVTFSTDVPGADPSQRVDLSSAIMSGGEGANTTLDTEWHEYTATIIPALTSSRFSFGIDSRPIATDFFIDDMLLIADGSSTNQVEDGNFETAFQSHLNGDGNGWATANWVDLHWQSEFASLVHVTGNPAGPKSLYIEAVPAAQPTVRIARLNGQVTLTFTGILQSAEALTGGGGQVLRMRSVRTRSMQWESQNSIGRSNSRPVRRRVDSNRIQDDESAETRSASTSRGVTWHAIGRVYPD